MKTSVAKWLAGCVLLISGWSALAGGGGAGSANVAGSAPAAGTKPAIFVCGDSTSKFAGNETLESDMQGWGTPLAKFFDPEKVKINNVGHAGTSSLTYYQGDWPKVLPQVKAGDFVLIVFGINDGGKATPNGTGDEVTQGPAGPDTHTYGWYMGKMATDVRGKGGHPIYLTVTTRNIWTNPKVKFTDATPQAPLPPDYDPQQDKIERGTGNGRYTQWTKDMGAKLHVPVFDLTNYCADVYEKMGRVEVNKFYKDHNHTHAAGAETVAKCIVSGLKGLKDSPFVPLLSTQGRELPTAEAKFVSDNLPGAATEAAGAPNSPTVK